MAQRVPTTVGQPASTSSTPAAQAAGEGDLSVLFPDSTLEIEGRTVTIREYRFGETFDVLRIAGPLIDSLAAGAEQELPTWPMIRKHLVRHKDVALQISAMAGDVEPEWLAGLSHAQGALYQQVWFSVNSRFFMQEVAVIMVERQRRSKASAGPTSSSPSLPAASEILDASPSTRNGS